MQPFRYAHAAGPDWRAVADACLEALRPIPPGANLGLLYLTDSLGDDAGAVIELLREGTGIQDWVGAVGIGICATGTEYYEDPAAAVMLAEFPPDGFRVFTPLSGDLAGFDRHHGDWIRRHDPMLALVHGDGGEDLTPDLIRQLARRTAAGFLVGGIASARGNSYTIANEALQGGLSGVLLGAEIGVITRLSQGCTPIGPHRTVTAAQGNILITLDNRPALDALKTDIGPDLAANPMHIGGLIFAGLPIPASDTGDYLVRDLLGIDPNHGLVAVAEELEPGHQLMFCRRDPAAARADLDRMLKTLKGRLSHPPRGGVYCSCLGRGIGLFGPDSAELRQIQDTLGDFPLVGFYASGEISQDRLYGYTGVLTLFT